MSWLKEKKHYRPVHEKKVRDCHFCQTNTVPTLHDLDALNQFLDKHGRIVGSRTTGNCRKHQKRLELIVKQARELSFNELPHVPAPDYHLRGR